MYFVSTASKNHILSPKFCFFGFFLVVFKKFQKGQSSIASDQLIWQGSYMYSVFFCPCLQASLILALANNFFFKYNVLHIEKGVFSCFS